MSLDREWWVDCTGPSEDSLLTLEDLKLHCRIDGSEEDAYLTTLLEVATRTTEKQTGLVLRPEGYTLSTDGFPRCGKLFLHRTPAVSIESVTYVDTDGVEQTWSDWILVRKPQAPYLIPAYGNAFPSARCYPGSVSVVFSAGASAPVEAVQAVRLLVGHWYEHRASVSELTLKDVPQAYSFLVDLIKVWEVYP